MNKTEAVKNLAHVAYEDFKNGDGWYTECNDELNDASRAVVQAYLDEHGECWLGNVNLYGDDRKVVWKHTGEEIVYNFGATFVLANYDAELEKMILERKNTPYLGGNHDYKLIEIIFNRIEQLGGHSLTWT